MSVSAMRRLTVLAPARASDDLVRRLMRLRCVEIRAVPLDDGLLRQDCDEARAEAERRVAEIEAALPSLARFCVKPKPWGRRPARPSAEAFRASGREAAARSAVAEVLRAEADLAEARRERERLDAAVRSLAPWLDYDEPLETGETERCAVLLGVLPPKTRLSDAAAALDGFAAALEEVSRDGTGVYAAAVCPKGEAGGVGRALGEIGFRRVSFANLPAKGAPREAAAACRRRVEELDVRVQTDLDRLSALSPLLPDAEALYDIERTSLNAAVERQKLARTGQCVVLDAWIPADREARVTAALDRLDCAYETADPAPGDDPPILLRNGGFASNFEWVVGMYAYPKYGTFDPTVVMSVFYFLIFGLMFADVGYGLILTLAGFLVPRFARLKEPTRRSLHMFGYCGVSCMLLGVVFGGWFGDLPYALMTAFMGYESAEAAQAAAPFFNGLVLTLNGARVSLNPLSDPMTFLIVSLGMGAVHLLAGMAVKFCLLCRKGDVAGAVGDVGAWWVLFAGLGLLAVNRTAGGIVAGVGALAIVLLGGRASRNPLLRLLNGLKSLYGIINYASDLLSYSRILALGLAAGVIAQVVNLLATLGGPSVGGFLVMVLVLLLGHTINLGINALGSFVHTSRLQYLEFFGKFYEDGGTPFQPALPSDRFSTEEPDADAPRPAVPHPLPARVPH